MGAEVLPPSSQMKSPPLSSSTSSDSALPAKVTSIAQLAEISDFKEALAEAELVDPISPSVAVYTIHSTDNR